MHTQTKLLLPFFLLLFCIVVRAGVFDVVAKLPAEQRVDSARSIYHNKIEHNKDSVFAIAAVKQLVVIARQLDDRGLECFATSSLADRYARTRGFSATSTQLHLQAIEIAKKNNLTLLLGMCNYKTGRYYYNFNNYPLAFEFLLRADNIFGEMGYDKVPEVDGILFFIANIYYETGDYGRAKTYYLKILKQNKIDGFVHLQTLNTLALIAKREDSLNTAMQYFEKTLAYVSSYNDTLWMAISYGNIGNIYFERKLYSQAVPLLQQSSRVCLSRKEWGDAYIAFLTLAKIYVVQNKLGDAKKRLDTAQSLQQYCNGITDRRHFYEALAPYYEKTGQLALEVQTQRKLLHIRDTLSAQKDIRQYHNIQLRIETEKHLGNIIKLEAEASASALERNAIITILLLLMMLLLVLYNRYRLKTKKDAEILLQKQALLELEKLRAQEQLDYAEEQLQGFTHALLQKNVLVEQFSTELEQLKQTLPGDAINDKRAESFNQLLQSAILTNKDWDNFKALFDKVHQNFLFRLKEKANNLSEADTRLIALMKLQLSSREIANMLGVGMEAVKKSKQRLRKKIFTENEETELEDWVALI